MVNWTCVGWIYLFKVFQTSKVSFSQTFFSVEENSLPHPSPWPAPQAALLRAALCAVLPFYFLQYFLLFTSFWTVPGTG